jgi:hypothetical protein
LVYLSNENGEMEVFVTAFPDLRGKWQVSPEGGHSPRWSQKGNEIFYLFGGAFTETVAVMVVDVETETTFRYGKPKELFTGNFTGGARGIPYDFDPDRNRFLMMKDPPLVRALSGPRKIIVVTNWFEELKERVSRD